MKNKISYVLPFIINIFYILAIYGYFTKNILLCNIGLVVYILVQLMSWLSGNSKNILSIVGYAILILAIIKKSLYVAGFIFSIYGLICFIYSLVLIFISMRGVKNE